MLSRILEKVRSHRTVLVSIAALMGNQVLAGALTAVGGLIQARYVAPDVLGYYSSFAILAGYLTFLHMGSLTALQRDYPYWLGKGDAERARDVTAVCQGWIVVVCWLTTLVYAVLVVAMLASGNYRAACGWASQLIATGLMFYALYLGCTYRTSREFVSWSKAASLTSLTSFLLVPLVVVMGFWGLCIRGAVPTALNTLLLYRRRPVKVRSRLNFRDLWGMVKFGLPMDMAGFLATSCTVSTMNSIVLKGYGAPMLGLFAFARVAETSMDQFGAAIQHVYVPRITHEMGATESVPACTRMALRATLGGTLFMLVVIAIGIWACEPFVRLVTPKYLGSVPIVRALLWIGLYPILLIPRAVLIAARKSMPVTVGSAAAFVCFVGLAFAALYFGFGPLWVAVAYLASRAVNVIVCYVGLWLELRRAVPAGQHGQVALEPVSAVASANTPAD